MDLVLALLIGVAVGFSLGVYVARHYKANPRLEAWQREVIREISSWLGQELDKTLIKLGEGLADETSQRLQSIQADLEEFRLRLLESYQSFLQVWGKDLTQAISVKLAEHSEQLNSQQAILENLVKEARGIYQQLQVALKKSSRLEISRATDQNSQKDQAAIHKTIENSLPDDVPRDKEKVAASNMLEVDISKIKSFLNSKKIKIKERDKKIKSIDKKKEKKLDQIADLMGSHYSLIKRFYGMIKSNMNSGNSFSIDLRDEPQQVIGTTCQVATELYKIAFLEEYRYSRAPKCLKARASRSSQALNFLSGNWLERYVRNRLICLAKRQTGKIDFSYIPNAKVTLSNGDDFEMDLLFHVNDQFYWVESKTGGYQDKVQKYSEIASDLGLQRNQAIIVLADVSQDAKTSLSSLYHLSVISVDEVEATFERILKSHLREV
jgi:regulator of replication initiation timing